MTLPPQVIGYYCLVAGISMVAGWWVAFRNRPYLLSLGIFFLALAASLMLWGRSLPGPITPGLRWALRGTVAIAVLAFLGAVVLAVRETQQRLREVRTHYQAAADALTEVARAKEQQLRERQERPDSGPDHSDQDGPS